ncbi:peptide chain release factor 1 [bacterium]|nr:peptide chain release factor 1 [Chloroflexi bacterium CFX6]RIL10613.1 MAG: peptide chain release factor 1 [bacterium]
MLPIDQLRSLEARYDAVTRLLGDPDVVTQPERLRQVSQEQAELEPLVAAWRAYRAVVAEIDDTAALADGGGDADLVALAEAELEGLSARRTALEQRIEELLVPADPRDARNVIVEIRAGTGGDEAGLFAGDLLRMYARYAEAHGFKVDLLSQNQTGIGGYKEVIFEVRGRGAYSRLKWESGVHRVQRVPETESQGRIHTSTATVAVLPEMDEIEIAIPDADVRVDVFRSSGPGGQSVNTTDSAVRLTHLPTGIVINCQDEKSQLQNRRKAFQVLRARLHQIEEDRRLAELGAERRSQVGTGERSEKIRTYNFPQSRVTDHRIGLTSYRLDDILGGGLDEFIDALSAADRATRLAAARDGHA